MSQPLSSVFQFYIEGLQPASQGDKQYGLTLWLQFLTEACGKERVQMLMDSGGPDAWGLFSKENLEAFISWQANCSFAAGTIEVRSAGIRRLCEVAMQLGCVSSQEWERIDAMNISEMVRKYVDKRNSLQRLSTRKERRVPLSDEQVAMLKQQPDTPQGRRDALLMNLLLDHGISCGVLADLKVDALDMIRGELHIPGGSAIPLSPDALLAAQRYLEYDTPADRLIQGSTRGGQLKGGMGYGAQIHRVRVLGEKIGISSLSPQDCQLWKQPVPRVDMAHRALSATRTGELAPDSVLPRSQDTRPRYRKNRPVFEVIGRGAEENVHYLGDDPVRAMAIFSSVLHGLVYRTVLINAYHRGHLVLPITAECSASVTHAGVRERNVPVQTFVVAATEMQARFAELLYTEPPRSVQVTFQGEPAAVVLPWSLYLAFQEGLSEHNNREERPTCQVTVMPMTQARNLFYSYSKRLAPVLSEEEHLIRVIEVTSNRKPVGAVLSWSQWVRYRAGDTFYASPLTTEDTTQEERTFTIATARHRLFLFAEQFAREGRQEIYKPIFVTNNSRPVFAVVPWKWYQLVSAFFLPQVSDTTGDK